MLTVFNDNKEINIVHFPGRSQNDFPQTISMIYDNAVLNPIENELTLLSCWTDNDKCILKKQCDKFNIFLNNILPLDYDYSQKWHMPNKIYYIIDKLKTVSTEYSLIMDGYDVLFSSTNDILKKFKEQKYHILFNATPFRYPDEEIDIIPNRDKLGIWNNFNAGVCLGYTEDLLKFYSQAIKYINVRNELNSEQKILRYVFKEYSDKRKQKFVFIDYKRKIISVMSRTMCKCVQSGNNYKLYLTDAEISDIY